MKKILIIIISVIVTCIAVLNSTTVNAAYDNTEERDELGYSYNLVKDPYFRKERVKIANPIFDEDWFSNVKILSSKLNTSKSYSSYGESLSSYAREYSNSVKANLGTTAVYGSMSASMSMQSENLINESNEEYISSFYHSYMQVNYKNRYALPNFKSGLELYKGNLHKNFYKNIETLDNKLKSKNIKDKDYYDFFDLYGTHIIHDIIYGSKIEANYYFNSMDSVVSKEKAKKISSEISANYTTLVTGNMNVSDNLFEKSNYGVKSISESLMVTTYGGNEMEFISYKDLIDNLRMWKQSVNQNNYSPVEISSDGMIEIWKIIPNKFSSIAKKIEEMFFKYDSLNSKKISEKKYVWENMYTRDKEYKITDTGRFKQPFDSVFIDLPLQDFIDLGYNKFDLVFDFQVRENYNGFKGIIMYSENKNDDSKIINWQEFTFANHDYEEYRVIIKNNDVTKIKDESTIFVRYGAHGNGPDTWFNKDMKISIIFRR
ncbi:MAC/perforin domain-containing protein [Haploplasma axanthum]|uniref:MAC/Perforin domain n=1 Tax=Haploplasma axanthum TaxID=29552 RepID=A0A449BBK7_HAPAX|nr:MAC/perforin domain-containing protein [Haploplasma axanthum]VEU79819.1 MAC/Perforin domain [Haploplasma axanthum]